MGNLELKEFLKKFHEMNQIFDQSDNLISCDYYDISEFKKTTIKEKQDLFIIHWLEYFLNFSSHQWFKKFPLWSTIPLLPLFHYYHNSSPRHWNTGLVSNWASLTSWGVHVSLALLGDPSSVGVIVKMPYGRVSQTQ